MYPLLILVVVIVIGAFTFLKLRKGKFVDKLTKDIWDEPDPTIDESIKDISAAEKALQAIAKSNDVEAMKLQKKSAKIGDYLAEKGVVKPKDKGKEADGNEVDK